MIALTKRQEEIYQFIVEFIALNKISPTMVEIADAFEFKSPNGSYEHVLAIEKKGWLVRFRDKARGIMVVGKQDDSFKTLYAVSGDNAIVRHKYYWPSKDDFEIEVEHYACTSEQASERLAAFLTNNH